MIEIPDDTDFSEQWGLKKIQALQAWTITRGTKFIKIAILDSGIDPDHADLSAKVVSRQNFTGSFVFGDRFGHGTHVAGIAAASTDNNLGIAGMGYDCSLMNIKVLGDDGNGDFTWIIQGIKWAADHGASVINLSLASDADQTAMKEAIDYAWEKGAVIVAAAGNNGKSAPTYPAAYGNCLSVAAIDSENQLYPFSNLWLHGSGWQPPVHPCPPYRITNTADWNGTSMAAAYVFAGLAGLAPALWLRTRTATGESMTRSGKPS
jgi:thermitase